MNRVFLVRHAESIANTQGFYQGQTYDTSLSDLGKQQARAVSHRLANTRIDIVYASPLKRTRETAAALSQTVLDEPLLLETNHGLWEGKSKAEIAKLWPKEYRLWQTRPSQVRFPQGERFTDVFHRAVTWLNKVVKLNQTVVAVTHSNFIMSLATYLLDLDPDRMRQFTMQPTAVTLVESHSPVKLVYLNDISHLHELKSDLSQQAI